MKKFLHMNPKVFLLALGLVAMSMQAAVVNYTADNTTIFRNPERGFLTQLGRHTGGVCHAVKGKESYLSKHAANDAGTLILVLYYLDEFNDKDVLPDSIIQGMNEDMQVLRDYGMKAIFRVAYAEDDNGKSGSDRSAADAPLSIIQKHLAQFKTLWDANTDVIYVFQAGFVGQYGEWYYTDNFGNHVEHINADCRALLDTALKAIPQNRCLQLRRPMFKQEYLDGVALTSEEAFTGTPKARLGHFNDAFLYHANNMGTYSDTATQKPFIAQETLYVPIGGETDITDEAQAIEEASYEATIAEMSRMHWTFIKSGYSETVTDMWRENGTFAELNRRLGYRYQLVSADLPTAANAGDKVAISLNIKNVGFAPLYNERHAYIVLKNRNASYSIQLATDPRRWLPNGVTTAINEQITIPAGVPDGTYNLYLHMPDIYPSLAEDSRYSIRFANEGVWQQTTGMNRLMASITIGDVEPEEIDPEIVALTDSLKKANASDYSEDMLWYEKDYFDFATGGNNLSAWAEWSVNVATPGKYTVTEVGYYPNGHNYTLQLLDGETVKAEFTTAETWAEGYKTITQSNKWDLTNIEAGVYTLRVKNAMSHGKPKLKALKIDLFGAVSSETVLLPAELNQANVANYSDNMLWYNTTYFDFATGGYNTDGWAEWRVNLKYPGEYIITEVGHYAAGHFYHLQLLDGETVKAEYNTAKTYSAGDLTITQTTNWDLSAVEAGLYRLRVNNALNYGDPKLQSLTLEYDGELPTDITNTNANAKAVKTLRNGQLFIERDGQVYTVLGQPIR